MPKSSNGSIAPKERINIVYKPATGNRKETVELPLKLMVLGDFSQKADDRQMEEREPVSLNSENFDEVMSGMNLSVDMTVADRISGEEDNEISVHLDVKGLKDLTPGNIVASVPELKKMLELREALKALKGPLGNVPAMRKMLQDVLQDEAKSKELMKELGIS